MNRYDIAIHKRRVLAGIKAAEKRKETHPKKDRKASFRRPRLRYHSSAYLPWEVQR